MLEPLQTEPIFYIDAPTIRVVQGHRIFKIVISVVLKRLEMF